MNRTVNSSDALSCAMANAVVDEMDYMWNAFDEIGGISVTVG